MPDDVVRRLRDAYDRRVEERGMRAPPAWETAERDSFLEVLRSNRAKSLLELGAATGTDAAFFASQGLEVVCIDLSPEMVERCRAQGLVAHEMDVSDLLLPADTFDAVYAMNCLVHVPSADLRRTLEGIRRVLKPGGLFYLGIYGGREFEGVWEEDHFEPKRFFCHHTDEELTSLVGSYFMLETFRSLPHGWQGLHFQSLILKKAGTAASPGDRHDTPRPVR